MEDILISPLNGSRFKCFGADYCQFFKDDRYPLMGTIPILISETNALFDVHDILLQKPQTQNKAYSNKNTLKNFVRASLLPKLNKDWDLEQRYKRLAQRAVGKRVLIIGAGNKVRFYKDIFFESDVIVSDVHAQFSPDVVFDVHEIPFADESFDLIIAAQVFEHTVEPWIAAKELERVSKLGGIIQIEVPFAFPYHGAPYDFFRFTFTGLRSLFRRCQLTDYKASEGIFSAVAVCNSQALVEISSHKFVRYGMLIAGRCLFFWLKYLDLLKPGRSLNDFAMPKGYHMTFELDGSYRDAKECFDDFSLLLRPSAN